MSGIADLSLFTTIQNQHNRSIGYFGPCFSVHNAPRKSKGETADSVVSPMFDGLFPSEYKSFFDVYPNPSRFDAELPQTGAWLPCSSSGQVINPDKEKPHHWKFMPYSDFDKIGGNILDELVKSDLVKFGFNGDNTHKEQEQFDSFYSTLKSLPKSKAKEVIGQLQDSIYSDKVAGVSLSPSGQISYGSDGVPVDVLRSGWWKIAKDLDNTAEAPNSLKSFVSGLSGKARNNAALGIYKALVPSFKSTPFSERGVLITKEGRVIPSDGSNVPGDAYFLSNADLVASLDDIEDFFSSFSDVDMLNPENAWKNIEVDQKTKDFFELSDDASLSSKVQVGDFLVAKLEGKLDDVWKSMRITDPMDKRRILFEAAKACNKPDLCTFIAHGGKFEHLTKELYGQLDQVLKSKEFSQVYTDAVRSTSTGKNIFDAADKYYGKFSDVPKDIDVFLYAVAKFGAAPDNRQFREAYDKVKTNPTYRQYYEMYASGSLPPLSQLKFRPADDLFDEYEEEQEANDTSLAEEDFSYDRFREDD